MSWWKASARPVVVLMAVALPFFYSGPSAKAYQAARSEQDASKDSSAHPEMIAIAEDEASGEPGVASEMILSQLRRLVGAVAHWYIRTEPADRVALGGLAGCAAFGLGVLFERSVKLRRRRIVPTDFTARFLDRLHDGKLDCGAALDHCELNPSPAARIALAAVRRWGRPASDLERAVSLAHRVETDRLRRNVGSLRRIAALAPLIGLLGTLLAVGRVLESIPPATAHVGAAVGAARTASPAVAWGPALSGALTHVCAGIVIAALALVAYDGLQSRIEKLTAALDRVGAETIDAIATVAPVPPPALPFGASPARAKPAISAAGTEEGRRSVPPPHHTHVRYDASADLGKRYDQAEAGF